MMWRLAAELDQLGHPDLADRVDRIISESPVTESPVTDDPYRWIAERLQEPQPGPDPNLDIIEEVGRRYISGMTMDDVASALDVSPNYISHLIQRFWARHPDLEDEHAKQGGISISWDVMRQVAEAADLGFTFPQVAELLDLPSEHVAEHYYRIFRERFPDDVIGGTRPIRRRRTKKLSPAEAILVSDAVGELRTQGATFKQIADRIGTTADHAKILFYRHYIPRHPEAAPVKNLDANVEVARKAKAMYIEGLTEPQIMASLGITSDPYNIMMSYLPPDELVELLQNRKLGHSEQSRHMLDNAEEAGTMRIDGKRIPEIAATLGVTPSRISRWLSIFSAMHPESAARLRDLTVIERRNPPPMRSASRRCLGLPEETGLHRSPIIT